MKEATIIFYEPITKEDYQSIEEACIKLEDAGFTVYNELSEESKSALPRPKRPV